MTTIADPDPRFKNSILSALMKFLYSPVGERHTKQGETMILKNTQLMNSSVRAFRYKGELYRSELAPRGPVLAPKLHADLVPELEDMLREQEEIHRIEEPLVKGYITQVLNLSANVEDYLLLLPSCIHPPIRALNLLSQGPRQFPTEAHAALHLEQHAHQIQLIKERMATNLLFQL